MSIKTSDVEAQLAALETLDAATLRKLWPEHFGTPAPKRLSRDMLMRAIAYRIQEKAYGGLKPATVRKLRQIAANLRAGRAVEISAKAPTLRPGAQLVREWNGEPQIVEVLKEGFRWKATTYPTLSAVARAITGARWSGPRFFGLLDKRGRDGAAAARGGAGE